MKSINQIIKEATKDLRPKQAKFVAEYCTNGQNGAKAARDAGYSAKCDHEIAAQNLAKVSIREAKEKIMSAVAEQIGLTPELVLGKVMQGVQLPFDKENNPTITKCCELAGRHLKLFTDKTETEVTVKSHEEWLDELK